MRTALEAHGEQVRVFHHELKTNRFAGEVADVAAVFETDNLLNAVAEDFQGFGETVAINGVAVFILNLDSDAPSSRCREIDDQLFASEGEDLRDQFPSL